MAGSHVFRAALAKKWDFMEPSAHSRHPTRYSRHEKAFRYNCAGFQQIFDAFFRSVFQPVPGSSMNSQKLVDRSRRSCQKRCTVTTDKTSKGQQEPQPAKAGFIQASSLPKTDPARERADIPPGGTRSRTYPEMGRGRRIVQWQQRNPPFSHPRGGSGEELKRANGQWF